MPEPAPTVQQLLAFYLEAGVDCALGDAPVDRLAESDSVAVAAAPREIVPPRPAREIPAAMPAAPRADAALAPDEAISSAREAARTAPSLEVLRQLRSDPQTAQLPVIMYSALADAEFQRHALEKGANDYWVKSGLNFAELGSRLSKYLC